MTPRSAAPSGLHPVQPIRNPEQRRDFERQAGLFGLQERLQFRAVYTREALLYAAIGGPEDAPLVVLLHGFPDAWFGWGHQIEALLDAGYRVALPDQRGYHYSDKPTSIDAYQLPLLGDDIVGLIEALGHKDAHVVGHDWGGAVTWWLAQYQSTSLRTATVLNCPDAAVMGQFLKRLYLKQLLKSWYIVLFQLPKIPELLLAADDYRFLTTALQDLSNPGAFSDDEVEAYRKAWSQPGALSGMVNWYRAARRAMLSGPPPSTPAHGDNGSSTFPINTPTTVIWGKQDLALDPALVQPSAARCKQARIHWLHQASHWVHRDAPQKVNDLILQALTDPPTTPVA